MLAHRQVVKDKFEIPWTAITPRMQRLLYAINAIIQPENMIAAGVFCGNTFISNAGAGAGPGASYKAKNLIGVEIKPQEAERAERNTRRIDPRWIPSQTSRSKFNRYTWTRTAIKGEAKAYTWKSSRPATTKCLPAA